MCVQMSGSLFLVPSLGLFFCFFVLSNYNVLAFILMYIIFYYYPLEASLFSKEGQKGVKVCVGMGNWEG